MATDDKQQSKVGFLRELFRTDPGVKLAAANAAWSEAGYEGKISDSSFYVAKKEFGDATSGGAGGGTSPPKAGAEKKRGAKAGRATRPKVTATNGQDSESLAPSAARPSRGTAERERVLVEAEADIDDLLDKLRDQGGLSEALESLRRARRILARQHEA